MTLTELKAIFIQAVQDMAFIKGLQINTIFITDRQPDIRQDTLGATYQDFLDGNFWARDWIHGGAQRGKLKATWPVMIIEQGDIEADCIDSQDLIFPFDILVIDQVGCDNCPNPEERSASAIKENTLTMLRSFLNEVYSFEKWELDRSPDPNTIEWISKGRQAYLAGLVPPIDTLGSIEDLASMVDPEPLIFREWGQTDDIRGYFVSVKFNICRAIPSDYIYNKPVAKKLAVKSCDSC